MFTGIIQQLGRVAVNRGRRLTIHGRVRGAAIGASVAVNGVCLTVVRRRGGIRNQRRNSGNSGRRADEEQGWLFDLDVSPETLRLTTLGSLKAGNRVNLEGAMRASDFLGGHLVSGHVDARGNILEIETLKDASRRVRISLPSALSPLVAYKGSIAVDGVSLTVTGVGRGWFETVLIPHTLKVTTLGTRRPRDPVNLETDVMARYVLNMLRQLPHGARPLRASRPVRASRKYAGKRRVQNPDSQRRRPRSSL